MEIELPEDSPHGWTLVAASGDVDVTSAERLRDCLSDLVSGGSGRLILDLEAVDFMDSSGLGVLVDATNHARDAGGDLRVVCTNSRLLDVVSNAGVADELSVADSAEEAYHQARGL